MAFSLVASVSGIRGAATAPIDTTGASLIVIGTGNAFGNATITDSKGNPWVPLTPHVGGGAGNHRFFYALYPTVGPSHTFTPAGSYASCIVYAFSGPVNFSVESGAGFSSGLGPYACGSVTPPLDGSLIITGLTANNGATDSVTTAGFGTVTTIPNGPGVNMQNSAAWQIQATAAAINPTWLSSAGSHDWIGVSAVVFVPQDPSPTVAKVSGNVTEILNQVPNPAIRVTQNLAEVIVRNPNPAAVVTQLPIEVLVKNTNPAAIVTQEVIEVLIGAIVIPTSVETTRFYITMP